MDDAGRVETVATPFQTYADLTVSSEPYVPDGRIAQMQLGNGLWETRDYQVPGVPTRYMLGTTAGNNNRIELEYS